MSSNRNEREDQAAGGAKEKMKREASGAAEDLRTHGEEIARTARARAEAFAAEQKEASARQVKTVAQAVDKAADELETASPELARYTREVASRVGGVSEALSSRSVSDLFDEANRFARREPAAFFGAAMVAGFALARFLESSARHDAAPSSHGEGSATYEQTPTGSQP